MIHDFVSSRIFLLALTVGCYVAGVAVYRRTRIALLHPVLLSVVALISLLHAAGVEYGSYAEATELFSLLLNMSVVALGYLLWEQVEMLRAHALSILVTVVVGSLVGIGSVVGIVYIMGAERSSRLRSLPSPLRRPLPWLSSNPSAASRP